MKLSSPKMEVFPFQSNLNNLDPSYERDLDLDLSYKMDLGFGIDLVGKKSCSRIL